MSPPPGWAQGDPTLDSFLKAQDPALMAQPDRVRSPAGSVYSSVAPGMKPPSPRVRKPVSPSGRSVAGSYVGSVAGSMPGQSGYGQSAYGSVLTGYDLGGGGYEVSEDEQKLLAAIQVLEAAMQARWPATGRPAAQPRASAA